MKISTRGRYALRLMVFIAFNSERIRLNSAGDTVNPEWTSLKDVSENEHISMKYLEQIVGELTKARMLLSKRGPKGGYALARKPEEYTVGEILRAIEGDLAPVACLENCQTGCRHAESCSTIDFWMGYDRVIDDYVNSVRLSDLVLRKESIESKDKPLNYVI